jgi:FdhD protein
MKGVALRHVVREGSEPGLDAVAVEEPLEIRIDGEAIATTMRTPGADADLALGFLLAEGIVADAADVGTVTWCGRPDEEGYGNVLDVRSAAGIRLDPERILEGTRFQPIGSACGVCGRRSIDGLLERAGKVDGAMRLDAATVIAAVEAIRSRQPIFAATGGLHAALLVSASGAILASAEDVGRHNAVDKVVGACVRRGLLGARAAGVERPAVLAVSGRAGFEIVQKAAAAGVPVVASVSAPTSLAVDLAEATAIALCAFVRGGRFNVYANAWRVGLGGGAPPASG